MESKVLGGERAVLLLSSCVPDLCFDASVSLNGDGFGGELYSYGGFAG